MNTFGKIYKLTTFGESHGPAIGGIIDGVPSGITIDIGKIQHELDRRRPGQNPIVTQRQEADKVEILSGIFEGKTLGTPIGFIIRNSDQHSSDYEELKDAYRPNHADYTYDAKFGFKDYRGGGRSSARETASRIVGGSVAKQILEKYGVKIYAYTSSIGNISLPDTFNPYTDKADIIESNNVRCPDEATAELMEGLIQKVKSEGDTIGGIITGVIEGMPAGVGEPVFDKLQAVLAHAMLSINAAKGFEYGTGFSGSNNKGSEIIDEFYVKEDGHLGTKTNNSGGIQGGISNGEPIYFRVAFKPVATLLKEVSTIDRNGNSKILKMRGRHDPCVVPRAVPIVEAMAAMTVLDALLIHNARQNKI